MKDYLDLARALLPPEKILRRPGQFLNFNTTTVGLLSHAVRKRGPKFISQYVVPPMLVNSLIGIVLFTTYDQLQPRLMPINPCFAPYFAGLMAGFAQSVIATPFDSVKIRMETQQLLDGRHRSMSAYYRWVFNKLGVSGAYRGFALTAFKDSLGFALFFGVFESSKKLMPTILPNRTQELDGSHRWYLALRSSTFVILSGMSAGLAFQTVDYPLEKIKTLLLIRAGRMELRRPPISRLYLKAYKQLALIAKVEGPAFFFRGFTSSLYKAIPATALGFACYEGLRNTLG
ncbi:hypothetical protein L0F63_003074 [Massospora cicadina]|nr:hypothetical protein L0F63_003074 [Massospora cicadina]